MRLRDLLATEGLGLRLRTTPTADQLISSVPGEGWDPAAIGRARRALDTSPASLTTAGQGAPR